MTDYTALSDEEINRAVGDVLELEWANLDNNYNGLCYWENGELCVFNPIKDPAVGWPIIVNFKIDIQFRTSMPNPVPMAKNGDSYSINKNPLRAAMIVFLIMQENKQ